MAGFEVIPYKSIRDKWLRGFPYAALVFISYGRQPVSYKTLSHLLRQYDSNDVNFNHKAAGDLMDMLLQNGQVFETSSGRYYTFPPYAIQKGDDIWLILGDARIDRHLAEEAADFEISSNMDDNNISLERRLHMSSDIASNLFDRMGIRPFSIDKLIDLIPEAESAQIPFIWSDFNPNPYPRWEHLNDYGRWVLVPSGVSLPVGFCCGIEIDKDKKPLYKWHFYRHNDGWSPVTTDDARLWALKQAAKAGKDYTAKYLLKDKSLVLPACVPYPARVALLYLGTQIYTQVDQFIVKGIDYRLSEKVCRKLSIKLSRE